MSMYKTFETNPTLEKSGIILNYGDFRVTIARAGGANKRYSKVLEARTKPYRRAIQMEAMDNDRAAAIFKRVYAETIILDWETGGYTDQDGNFIVASVSEVPDGLEHTFKQGIENPEGGDLLPFTVENVEAVLTRLNDLFLDIKEQAEKSVLFRKAIQEAEGKN